MTPLIGWMPGIWELMVALAVILVIWSSYRSKSKSKTAQRLENRHLAGQLGEVVAEGRRLTGYDRKAEKPERRVPGWFLPAGVASMVLAILGFLASAAVGGRGDLFLGLFAGVLNPLFFVGLPLGIYWLVRYTRREQPYAKSPVSPPEESNPKLTHCPDCGRHVSRLATTCPHCGRPLAPEKPVE